jgi:hypothetical protein
MTRDDIAERIEFWRERLTPEWRITLSAEDPDNENNAQVRSSEHYHWAEVRIAPKAAAAGGGELDVTIVHELLHLLMRDMRRIVDLVEDQVHRDVHTIIFDTFLSAEEAAVERLARIISLLEHPTGLVYGTYQEA